MTGITVILNEQTQSGTDGFNRPTYTTTETEVEDVLVYPATSDDVIAEMNLSGKMLVYYLCVPKDDAHEWTDKTVTFYGETWHVFSYAEQWIDANNPLRWNRRYKVERYNIHD